MEICAYNACTGCGACENLCPHKCITIQADENGELHPVIDGEKCVQCKKCSMGCPENHDRPLYGPEKVYASWRTDPAKMRDSASGGVGAVFAESWIRQGGVVFGTKFDASFRAVVSGEETQAGIEAFQGSKYVQSYTGTAYQEVREALKQGRKVLFFGTPCQLAGLYAVVDRDTANLTTVEILCHGVSPDAYFQAQLRHLEKKLHGRKFDRVTFRTNRWMMDFYFGLWNGEQVVFSQQAYENPYFCGFLTGLTLRESCYQCRYKHSERLGDLLIGDFIGFGKHVPFDQPHERPSLILVMNGKGAALVEASQGDLVLVERTVAEALIDGRSLREPFPRHEKQQEFRRLYREKGFIDAIHDTVGAEIKACKRSNARMHIKRRIKTLLHKFFGIRIQGGKLYHGN